MRNRKRKRNHQGCLIFSLVKVVKEKDFNWGKMREEKIDPTRVNFFEKKMIRMDVVPLQKK
jgi:hypothetical protein